MKGLFRRRQTWWLRFTPVPGADQIRLSLETNDEAEAIVRSRELIERYTTQVRQSLDSCAGEISAYIADKREDGLSASTLSTRKYVLSSFVSFLDVDSPKLITSKGVQRWFDHHRKRNPHTAADYHQTVQLWLKWLIERGKLTTDVSAHVQIPKLPMRRRRKFLLPDQAMKLLDACSENAGLKFALYCGLHAGLRKLEIIEAMPHWFDLDAGLLHVQATDTFQPKDRDNRTIPLTDEFRDWLISSYGLKEPFMLEPKATHGSYRYRYDFRKAFDGLAKRCGFEWLTFHDLRRTFASLHVSRGTSIYKVARWLGDGVEVVERHYGHLIPQDSEINSAWRKNAVA